MARIKSELDGSLSNLVRDPITEKENLLRSVLLSLLQKVYDLGFIHVADYRLESRDTLRVAATINVISDTELTLLRQDLVRAIGNEAANKAMTIFYNSLNQLKNGTD